MTLVPRGHESEAEIGIPLGPPDTRGLGLPDGIDVRLNNNLFNRGLITWDDVRRRPMEVTAALQSAYRLDAGRIISLYREVRDGAATEQK